LVEGTESLIDSPMIVNPGIAMTVSLLFGKMISTATDIVNIAHRRKGTEFGLRPAPAFFSP
jgi:hypothetical protein